MAIKFKGIPTLHCLSLPRLCLKTFSCSMNFTASAASFCLVSNWANRTVSKFFMVLLIHAWPADVPSCISLSRCGTSFLGTTRYRATSLSSVLSSSLKDFICSIGNFTCKNFELRHQDYYIIGFVGDMFFKLHHFILSSYFVNYPYVAEAKCMTVSSTNLLGASSFLQMENTVIFFIRKTSSIVPTF